MFLAVLAYTPWKHALQCRYVPAVLAHTPEVIKLVTDILSFAANMGNWPRTEDLPHSLSVSDAAVLHLLLATSSCRVGAHAFVKSESRRIRLQLCREQGHQGPTHWNPVFLTPYGASQTQRYFRMKSATFNVPSM